VCHIVIRKPSDDEPDKAEKKERVIHTRVPESLEAELRHKAEDLGISVSNLVRNVLGHAFGLVGDVVADSHAIARAATLGSRRAPPPPPAAPPPASPAPPSVAPIAVEPPASVIDDVLAWQASVLGKNAVCARCNAILPRGSDAAVGVAETTGVRLVICAACLAALRA
jgi:hypothetical protein